MAGNVYDNIFLRVGVSIVGRGWMMGEGSVGNVENCICGSLMMLLSSVVLCKAVKWTCLRWREVLGMV
jgi:hypothetical protein